MSCYREELADELGVDKATVSNWERNSLLLELSAFGSGNRAPADARPPGNLRTVAVAVKEALRRVVHDETLHAELVVDAERFRVDIADGTVAVRYGASPDADVSVGTRYLALIAVTDGDISLDEFARDHVSVIRGKEADAHAFLGLMGGPSLPRPGPSHPAHRGQADCARSCSRSVRWSSAHSAAGRPSVRPPRPRLGRLDDRLHARQVHTVRGQRPITLRLSLWFSPLQRPLTEQ